MIPKGKGNKEKESKKTKKKKIRGKSNRKDRCRLMDEMWLQ